MLPKNILITGASGLLGGVAVRELTRSGHNVFAGTRTPSKLEGLPDYKNWQLRKIDLNDTSIFAKALKGIEVVVHLAALNYNDCETNPDQAIRVNTENVNALCQHARVAGVNHFIYMSSIHTYGTPLKGDLNEESTTSPQNIYAQTHRDAENIVLDYFNESSFNATIFRLSNAFGVPASPRVNSWSLIAFEVCKQAAQKRAINLNSSGIQPRNFIAVRDVAKCIEHFINLNKRFSYPIFNLGSPSTISIIDFVNLIREEAEALYKVEIPISKADTPSTTNDFNFPTDKIRTAGFECSCEIRMELRALLNYCELNKEII